MAHKSTKASETTTHDELTTGEKVKEGVPEATGAVAGLATGAAIGAFAGGPVGAAIGAAIGGPIGAAIGMATDYDEAEPAFRKHYEAEYKDQTDWDHAGPAYRFGWNTHDKDEAREFASYDEVRPYLKKSWNQKGRFEDMEPMIRTGWEGRLRQRVEKGGEVVLPVVEERLRIGKRQVETGGVEVTSRVTETPVEEQVHLHEEKVRVHRRPVDRPATAEDARAAMTTTSMEFRETAEEPVVQKEARVVEEIVLNKEARDRTETVRDKVRRTDVDVREKPGHHTELQPFETYDQAFRTAHTTHFADSGYTYDQALPAYRYGHNLAAEHHAGDWKTLEPEARRRWEERNPGTWEQFKDTIRHAWQEVTGRR